MNKIVMAKFTYRDPKLDKQFSVEKAWPCANEQDAENIVKYHGMKTGAIQANCVIEEYTNEEIKQATSSIAAKETNQAQCQ